MSRKWTESREKAALRASERATERAQSGFRSLLKQYTTVARQWIDLHFAASVNATGHEQSEFDPMRKALRREVDRLARMQADAPTDRLTYAQIREEQKALKKIETDVQPHAQASYGNDPWRRVASRVIEPRRERLNEAAMAPEHRAARIEEQQRIDHEREQQEAAEQRRIAEAQAKWEAEAPEREAKRTEQYAEVTAPLIDRARLDPVFAKRITRWGIDLERSDHEVARDPIWTKPGKGHDGKLVWAIVANEADASDREAEKRRKEHEAEQEALRKAWEEQQAAKQAAPAPKSNAPEPEQPKPQAPRPKSGWDRGPGF